MHTAEQKIARNNEKNSTDGYKNCVHLSTNAHPPLTILVIAQFLKNIPYYEVFMNQSGLLSGRGPKFYGTVRVWVTSINLFFVCT